MDRKRKKKIQNARVVMTNIFMGISVIAIVFVLMLVAMGYGFNEQGGIEQSGLIQISSNPKGASVEIDNETQFSRTDFNKMLSSGEHRVKIGKSGYDTWEKTIKVDAGLLTRIEWARLFPVKVETTNVANYNNLRLAEFSSNRKHLLTIEHDSPIILYSDIQGEKINVRKLSLNQALSNNENVLEGEINIRAWNENGNKVLVTWKRNDKTTWHILDLENIEKSINLNEKFGLEFNDVRILNDSASKLWALEKNNIHIIDTSSHTISGVLISNVEQFTNNKDVIAYVGIDVKDHNYRKIRIYKEGEEGSTDVLDLKDKKPNITLAMGSYWNESWLGYSLDNQITIFGGTYPSFDKPSKNSLKEYVKRELPFTPTIASTNQLGRIVAFAGSSNVTTIDIETRNYFDSVTEAESSELNWLDGYIFWENNDNKIIIRDFDGDNRREILTVNNQQPINITENNRWLYYFEIKEAEADKETDATKPETIYILKRQKLE